MACISDSWSVATKVEAKQEKHCSSEAAAKAPQTVVEGDAPNLSSDPPRILRIRSYGVKFDNMIVSLYNRQGR